MTTKEKETSERPPVLSSTTTSSSGIAPSGALVQYDDVIRLAGLLGRISVEFMTFRMEGYRCHRLGVSLASSVATEAYALVKLCCLTRSGKKRSYVSMVPAYDSLLLASEQSNVLKLACSLQEALTVAEIKKKARKKKGVGSLFTEEFRTLEEEAMVTSLDTLETLKVAGMYSTAVHEMVMLMARIVYELESGWGFGPTWSLPLSKLEATLKLARSTGMFDLITKQSQGLALKHIARERDKKKKARSSSC